MYNDYFGFRVSPFSATPDPQFFYTTPVYREAFATLQYGIQEKKGFIVVTGEVGTGKTTLLRKLMTHNLNGIIHTVFLFNTNLNFDELLQMLVCDLGLSATGSNKALLLQELNKYLLTQIREGHIVAVLVDESQNLSDEALEGLRLLSNMETDHEKLIQIVLMGQPELQEKLDRPSLRQLKQRIAVHCRISPLKYEEVKPYVDFRLRAAGYNGKGLFDSDAVLLLTEYSKGIPRLVNNICDNALLTAFATNRKSISAAIVEEVASDLRLANGAQNTEDSTSDPDRDSVKNLPQQEIQRTAATLTVNRLPEETAAPQFQRTRVQRRNDSEGIFDQAPPAPAQAALRPVVKGVSATLMIVLTLFVVASVIDPKDFVDRAGNALDLAKHNLFQWVLFIQKAGISRPLPNEVVASGEVAREPRTRWITIPRRSTVYQVAGQAYGANSNLGIDLIRDLNPDIQDLSKVAAGQPLLMPVLTMETLLRQQFDGSYDLILASFRREVTAAEYAKRVQANGYRVTITPRQITDDLLLHRLEISGLKTVEEANQAWLLALRNEWLVLPDKANEVAGERSKRSAG
jgi:putative secretion ATPase (PEP-CTERM system associated)